MSVNVVINSNPVAPDSYLAKLRLALKIVFGTHPVITATDSISIQKNAGIMSMFTSVSKAFELHIRKDVINMMISLVDVDDDPDLSSLKAQLLSVPEWTTDTSDLLYAS